MRRIYRSILCILLCAFGLTQTTSARAHPADVYTHAIHVDLSTQGFSIKWEIKPGAMLVPSLWLEADTDQDGNVSQQEADLWAGPRAGKFGATLNGIPIDLQLNETTFPSSQDAFQAGQEFVTINFSASWPEEMTGPYELVLHNGVEEQKSLNWYYVNARDGLEFGAPLQKNSELTLNISRGNGSNSQLLTNWDSSMPSLSPAGDGNDQGTEAVSQPVVQNSQQEMLLDLVRNDQFSISFLGLALVISLALGALHALTPGHGKTVVAAYLVGSRGTTWHAIVLGTIVTLTHTGSVLLLGMVTLAASQYILPTDLIPWLEIASGLLIVGLGLYLFWQRFRTWRANRSGQAVRKYSLQPSASKLNTYPGTYRVEKNESRSLQHHHGDGKLHSHEVPEAITWRSLIALGVSGGLVPCPDAIAILLVAIALNRVVLGLSLILAFSLGLAIVLIVIGLLMVHSRRLFDRFEVFNRLAPVMPVVSAAVVLALGLALTYGASTRAKENFNVVIPDTSRTGETRVLYLAEDENKVVQLFEVGLKDRTVKQATDTSNGVVDYAVLPDGSVIAYILNTDNLDNEIWTVRLADMENKKLSSCFNAVCSQPVWAPDGSGLVYERISLSTSNATGLATLWWLDATSGETHPIFSEAQLPGANARWSPDGKWLSYATPDGMRLYELETGQSHQIRSTLGAAGNWSPDGSLILYRDVIIRDNQFITQLFVYDLSSGISLNISPDPGFENILAAWSPDGRSIAVVRRDLSVPRGDQIWLMDPDGRNAHPLTTTPSVLHGSLNWSSDGKYLLYDLYDLDSLPLESSLQMVDVSLGEVTDLELDGYNPRWVRP